MAAKMAKTAKSLNNFILARERLLSVTIP
jgi:hypothetical protein